MSKPTTPLDSELAKIFGNNTRIFRAMRELFKQAGDLSPVAIEEALIAAGNADNKAVQALDILERIANAVELSSLAPQKEDIRDDDLTPRQEFVIPDTLADLAPRFEEDPNILRQSDIGKSVQAHSTNLDSIDQDLGIADDVIHASITGEEINGATRVSQVGDIGGHTTVIPTGQSFTITLSGFSAMLIVQRGGGQGAIVHVSNKSATVTVIADPDSVITLGAPAAAKIDITKSASSNTITITHGSAGNETIGVTVVGAKISSVTAPA